MKSIRHISGGLGNQMFQTAYLLTEQAKGNIPNIYLQDPKYFDEELVKKAFGDDIGYLSFVSIHIRRGDYVNNPFYVDLASTSYYLNAVSEFPDKNFLVFSDDPEFAKGYMQFLPKGRYQVMEGGTELEDFNQMASCFEGNIIANSSYSWWAAYLNPAPSKVVIAPKAWHPDGITRTVLPPAWIQI